MKNQKNFSRNSKEFNLPTEEVEKILTENYYNSQIEKIDNLDVDINHLEKIFTNKTYYLAMKIVPLLERKVLYLSFVENARLNDICKRLKLQKTQVIALRNKGIKHFKNNLNTLNKVQNGGDNK